MKRWIAATMIFAMLFSLAACGEKEETNTEPSSTEGSTGITEGTEATQPTQAVPTDGTEPSDNTEPSATEPSTTVPPTTVPPTTVPPTTVPPTTVPPTTVPPTTVPPTTVPPVTECSHTYAEATCTAPKTCTKCGVTEGKAKGHSWADATCTAPKTCSACKVTEGKAKDHSWVDATCTAPKTCSVCKATEGKAKGHSWTAATCTAPKTCSVCKATEGKAKDHSWADATYSSPKTCTACGATEGEPLPVVWTFADGGDHIIASNGVETIKVPIDTSHLPQSYENEEEKQVIDVRREHFSYADGWVVYSERYSGYCLSKVSGNAPGIGGSAGYSMVKIDGSKQIKLNVPGEVAGYYDGNVYYVRIEGFRINGEEEHAWLCRIPLSENMDFYSGTIVAELEGINNEYLTDAWIENGWIYYSCEYPFDETYVVAHRIKFDGTDCQKVS